MTWVGGLWTTSNDALKVSYVALIAVVLAVFAAACLQTAPHVPQTALYWLTRPGVPSPIPVEGFEIVDRKLVVVTEHDRMGPDEIDRLWSVDG